MKTKELQTENTQLRIEAADLKQQVAVLKKMVFGQKFERECKTDTDKQHICKEKSAPLAQVYYSTT